MRLAWKIATAPWRWWCGFLLAVGMRATSSNERMLAQDVETLTRDLQQRDARIRELEVDVKVAKFENALISAVNARDLKRVEAETAIHSEKVGQGA